MKEATLRHPDLLPEIRSVERTRWIIEDAARASIDACIQLSFCVPVVLPSNERSQPSHMQRPQFSVPLLPILNIKLIKCITKNVKKIMIKNPISFPLVHTNQQSSTSIKRRSCMLLKLYYLP